MTAQLTLRDVLNQAIQKEIESQRLYADLTQMIDKRSVKDAFRGLTRQEKGHQKTLERYLRGELKAGALNPGHVLDYKIAEKLNQSNLSPNMELKDVFLLAAEREKLAHEFYLDLAGAHPSGEVKQLLEDLSAQELGHKHRVEFLYGEVAFPQTDGG